MDSDAGSIVSPLNLSTKVCRLQLLIDHRKVFLRDAESLMTRFLYKHSQDTVLVNAQSEVKLLGCCAICLRRKIELSRDFTFGGVDLDCIDRY